MKLGIQVVSVYDDKYKKASFLYELNLMNNDKILNQKSLKYVAKSFSSDQKSAVNVLNNELQSFINDTKDEYDVSELSLFYKPSSFLEKKIEKENKDINFLEILNPKDWNAKMIKVFSNLIKNSDAPDIKSSINNPVIEKEIPKLKNVKPNIEEVVQIKDTTPVIEKELKPETNVKPNLNKIEIKKTKYAIPKRKKTITELKAEENNEIKFQQHSVQKSNDEKNVNSDESTIEYFVENMVSKENAQQELFKNKIKSMKDDNNIFINFAFTLEKTRKRIGVMFEYYDGKTKLEYSKESFFNSEFIGHGERNCAIHKIKQELKRNIEFLLEQNKKVTVNINQNSKNNIITLNDFFEKSGLNEKINISDENTTIENRTFQRLRHKINKDIDIYLKELKKPETVAVFTDGSVNKYKKLSGSGVVIRHQEKNKLLASRNYEKPDSTYSEFKAIALAFREIAENPLYKNKKIMIVSDNDLMSFSIRNKLESVENVIDRPYLEEICNLIKDNNMDVYFHNVKSHIHEEISLEESDLLYDFKYNKIADLVAGAAAGKKLSRKETQLIEEDTDYDPKYKDENIIKVPNKKTEEEKENRVKRFKKKPEIRRERNFKKN